MSRLESTGSSVVSGITKIGFTRNLYTTTRTNGNVLMVEEKYRGQIKYIRLSDIELHHFNKHTIRISERKTLVPCNLQQQLSNSSKPTICHKKFYFLVQECDFSI